MPQLNPSPTDAKPSSFESGPEIINVHPINSDQQTPQDRTSLPLPLPATLTPNSNALRENAGIHGPFASASSSSARIGKSPLRQSSVASLDAGTLPVAVHRPPQPASSGAHIGPTASNAVVAANLNAASTASRVQPAHQQLPGSSATVYGNALYSSPAPMPLAGSPLAALPPGFQPYPSAPPLPPSRPPAVGRPFFIPRPNNVYPRNQSSQSLDTSGMPPLIPGMPPQSSPRHYPPYAASPYSRVDPTSSSANQRPSNMPPSPTIPFIPPLSSVPDPPSQGPGFYYASPAPMNMESYPPELLSSYKRPVPRAPSRRPTLDAYVANDPFRAHNQRSTSPVDKNLTFDDIPLAPEDLFSSWRYVTPSGSRPNAMAVPPGPVPVIPPWPSAPYGYSNDYNGIYRPTPGCAQSAPQPVIPEYYPPAQPPVVRVDPQRAESPPTYPPTGYPGHVVDTGLGVDPNHGEGEGDNSASPIRTSDPTQPTVIEVGEPEANDSGSTAGDDQEPQPGRWNTDIPLIPVRRPTDDDLFVLDDDPAHNAETVHSSPYLLPEHMIPVIDDPGFWSRVAAVFHGMIPKESKVEFAPTMELESQQERYRAAAAFVGKTLPRQIYLHLLLRLPSLYFSRVARIFEEADLTLPEIKKMALETASRGSPNSFDALSFDAGIAAVPPQYEKLKMTWESFIDSVMREWKTFNIISVLLLSAILTILQISGAADDPVTRYLALLSLMCALMSLLFGCIYIIRFGSMRKTYKAAEWALEAKKSKTVIWWNVWVLLAMPAIWLTWSIVLYIACIMSFIWRTNAQDTQTPPVLSHLGVLLVRILLSLVLALGFVYGALVIDTFRHYGDVMDRAWKRRIDGWMQEKKFARTPAPYPAPYPPPPPPPPQPYYTPSAPMFYPSPNDWAAYDRQEPQSAPSEYVPAWGFSSPETAPYPSTPYARPRSPLRSNSSDDSSSSTFYATRSNTRHNRRSTFRPEDDMTANLPFNGLGYVYDYHPPPPPPPRPESGSAFFDPYAPRTVGLAVPPPADLPPIPGSAVIPEQVDGPPLGHDGGIMSEDEYAIQRHGFWVVDGEEELENRVRFRSPLTSAQASSFGGSDLDTNPRRRVLSDPYVGWPPSPSAQVLASSPQGPSSAQGSSSAQEHSPAYEPLSRGNTPPAEPATHEDAAASTSSQAPKLSSE